MISFVGAELRRGGTLRAPLSAAFGAAISIQVLNVVSGVLLARSLGPDGRGELAAVILWASTLAALGSIGIGEAATYHAARRSAFGGTLAATSAVLAGIQSVVLMSVGAAVVPLALDGYDGSAVRSALLFLAFIPINLGALYAMSILNGLQRLVVVQALRLLTVSLVVIALVTLALAGALSVRTSAIVYLGASLVVGVVAVVVLRRLDPSPLRVSLPVGRRLLQFGIRSHTGNASAHLNERLDQLVISAFLAPAQLGLYVVAVTLGSLTTLVGTSVSQVALPSLAALPRADAAASTRRLIALTLGISLIVSIPLIVFTPFLLELFFGEQFASTATAARVLLVAAVALSAARALKGIATGLGRPLDAGLSEAAALVVTMIGLAALLPSFGLVGAAIASLLAYGISAAWLLQRIAHSLGLTPLDLLRPGPAAPTDEAER